jgi:hypothetical protein
MKHGQLKVWWIPQVPMRSFEVEVPDARTGKLLLDVLADYDLFQFENNIKPDYCNTGGLSVLDERMEETDCWIEWEDDECDDIHDTETFLWEGR